MLVEIGAPYGSTSIGVAPPPIGAGGSGGGDEGRQVVYRGGGIRADGGLDERPGAAGDLRDVGDGPSRIDLPAEGFPVEGNIDKSCAVGLGDGELSRRKLLAEGGGLGPVLARRTIDLEGEGFDVHPRRGVSIGGNLRLTIVR